MSTTREECDQFPEGSRQWKICNGLADDLLPRKINGYRALWGMEPLADSEVSYTAPPAKPKPKPPKQKAVRVVNRSQAQAVSVPRPAGKGRGCGSCGGAKRIIQTAPKPNGYGPGSQLLKLWAGMPHCDACTELATKMDKWGAAGCQEQIEEIVSDILPRAKAWLTEKRPWVHRMLSMAILEDSVIRIGLRKSVMNAVEASRRLIDPQAEQDALAAIVPYYNFARSKSREQNYHRCVEALQDRGFPVYTTEAALEGSWFDVPEGLRVKRYVVRDPLFMKENLFNLTLKTLPAKHTAVAWLDADVVFDRPDIVQATLDALDKWPVVQMFSAVEWLDATGKPERRRAQGSAGIAYYNLSRKLRSASPRGRWPGLAWAARRSALDRMDGLYDGYPVGSGDVFAVSGFYKHGNTTYFRKYSKASVRHFWETWGTKAFYVVRGEVGYVEGTTRHLFHGNFQDRQYNNRHDTMKHCGFDPALHQERDANGIYRFSAACPRQAREWMEQYMLVLRKEDCRG